MNGVQTWYTNHYSKNGQVKGDVLAKLNKCKGPNKCFKLVPWVYSLDRNHLEPQNN